MSNSLHLIGIKTRRRQADLYGLDKDPGTLLESFRKLLYQAGGEPDTIADGLSRQPPGHRLPRLFHRRAGTAADRAAVPRLRRSGAHCRTLSARGVAFAAGTEKRRHLVLQRLSRHGPASESD